MATAREDITIQEGAAFSRVIHVRNSDGTAFTGLAGYTGRGQVRAEQDPTSALQLTFVVALDTPIVGDITFSLPADVVPPGGTDGYALSGWYDIEIENNTDAGDVKRAAQGQVSPDREVTA